MILDKKILHTTDKYIKSLKDAWIETTQDFLELFPKWLEDKTDLLEDFTAVNIREKQTIKCKIELINSEVTRNKKTLIKAVLTDKNGNYSEAVWFNRKFLLQKFFSWDEVIIFGQPKYEYWKLSFPNAEIEHYSTIRKEIVPVYSDVNYISWTWIASKMQDLKNFISEIPEKIPAEILEKKWHRTYKENIFAIHFPKNIEDFERAKNELGYTEIFGFQKTGIQKKYSLRTLSDGKAIKIPINPDLMKNLIENLPFKLTNKQKIVIFQILKDMESEFAMSRMLQWDVWTGKTIVALLVAIHAILEERKNNRELQIAIMAPTEILARQHFMGNEKWLFELGISSDLLVGSLTAKQKNEAKERLKSWQTNIIFGTHALIQEDVKFNNLALVVVDEQHRFGVEQRAILEKYLWKNEIIPHSLNMSATPIPRSLALTLYGDQDISVLNEYPEWRKPIYTRVVRENQRDEIYRFIEEEVNSWRQVYWISPLVEESETLEIASATQMYELLVNIFPSFTIGLIHGKMTWKEKDQIMQDFYDRKIKILSSTSVVEVGVNNPNATIICIEASERFGLSQLHQFRGRVGRGEHQSYCYLFTTKEYKSERLRAMEQTNDWFELAEIDLELRWPGEVYWVRQSGVPDMKFADLKDVDLIAEVRKDIEEYLENQKKK